MNLVKSPVNLLSELKECFLMYEPFWDEWLNYDKSSLSEDELYVIQAWRLNDFKVNFDNEIMFYNSTENIELILKKLKTTLPEFKNLILKKLVLAFTKLAGKDNIEIICNTPFIKIGMQVDATAMLIALGCETANELFSETNFDKLRVDEKFIDVLTTLQCLERYTGTMNPFDFSQD